MKILNEQLNLEATGLTTLTAILWGGNTVSIKLGLMGLPPLALAAARFILGGVVVSLYALLKKIPLRLNKGQAVSLFKLVLLFFVQIYLLNGGTRLTLAARATVFISTYPFFTTLFANFFIPGDKLTRAKLLGILLSFSGIFLVFAESFSLGNLQLIPGDLMVLGSAVLLGARQVYTKRLTQAVHPVPLLLWQAILSVPVFIAVSALLEGGYAYRLGARVAAAILYQGIVVAGACFLVQTHLIRRYCASSLAVFGFLTPLSGVILSGLLLGETVSPGLIFSVLLVGAGIAVVNLRSRKSAQPDDTHLGNK